FHSSFYTLSLFSFHPPPPTSSYTLSLHDALPIYALLNDVPATAGVWRISPDGTALLFASIPFAAGLNALAFDKRGSLFVSDPSRSEEHTSELQSRVDLVCRLLLEKKKKNDD